MDAIGTIACQRFICALTAGSLTPIGLPMVMVRLTAPMIPSGAWPDADWTALAEAACRAALAETPHAGLIDARFCCEISIRLTDDNEVQTLNAQYRGKDKLIGACIADIELAANAGAALALIPDVVAKEAIAAGKLEDGLRENFYEVVNIVSALLNGPSVPHLRLTDLVDGVPDEVIELQARAAGHKHYDVTIMDYAGGMLALVGV